MTAITRALVLALLLILLALVSPAAADSGPQPTPATAAEEEGVTAPQALEGDTGYVLDVTYNTFLSTNGSQGLAGRQLVDIEVRWDGANEWYGAIWVDDPNQPVTVLYYGLESPDVGDLITPRHGRVIDFERYHSDLHGEDRWALLFAMVSGGEQYQRRNDSAANIGYYDGISSDTNTHLIDIEAYVLGGNHRYSALWGDTFKTLHEVPAIQGDLDPEPLSTTLDNLLANFGANNQGIIGLYARNLRTKQSLAYRSSEPFYLASTAKIPIHIKYWREVQNGHLNGPLHPASFAVGVRHLVLPFASRPSRCCSHQLLLPCPSRL